MTSSYKNGVIAVINGRPTVVPYKTILPLLYPHEHTRVRIPDRLALPLFDGDTAWITDPYEENK